MKNVDIKDGLFCADRIIDSLIQTFFILHWQNHIFYFSLQIFDHIIFSNSCILMKFHAKYNSKTVFEFKGYKFEKQI